MRTPGKATHHGDPLGSPVNPQVNTKDAVEKKYGESALRKVVQIFNPVFVKADAQSFAVLVQKLTGSNSMDYSCREELEAVARAYCTTTPSTAMLQEDAYNDEDSRPDYNQFSNRYCNLDFDCPSTTVRLQNDTGNRDQDHSDSQIHSCTLNESWSINNGHHDCDLCRLIILQEEFQYRGGYELELADFELATARDETSKSGNATMLSYSCPSSSSTGTVASSAPSCTIASFLNRCAPLKLFNGSSYMDSSKANGGGVVEALDIWSGLTSDTPLPDIASIAPLLYDQ